MPKIKVLYFDDVKTIDIDNVMYSVELSINGKRIEGEARIIKSAHAVHLDSDLAEAIVAAGGDEYEVQRFLEDRL